MHAFIGFLKEFADKCHHGKEEGLLFPAMVAAGIPDKGGPIGVMLAEHTQGRQFIRDMEESLSTVVDRVEARAGGWGIFGPSTESYPEREYSAVSHGGKAADTRPNWKRFTKASKNMKKK